MRSNASWLKVPCLVSGIVALKLAGEGTEMVSRTSLQVLVHKPQVLALGAFEQFLEVSDVEFLE